MRIVLSIGLIVLFIAALLFGLIFWSGGTEEESRDLTERANRLTVGETDPFKGSRDAPIAVIVASSFSCPACKKLAPVLDQVLALYPDEVRVVWKDAPESITDGYRAAIAARCAQQQGRFWQYHDTLFRNQDLLATKALYSLWAKELGMKEDIFATCLENYETKALIDQNIGEVLAAEIIEVPYVQIGSQEGVAGVQNVGYFKRAIDALRAAP